tara:strand:+ start:377 stop:571 length:195 start_codon:yes stop_codon:yes gene_type:complete
MKKDKEEIEALKYAISTIAEIIHMQMPLKYQDAWLESIVKSGIWKPETEEVGACCRNGCERCEQ